MSGTYVLTVGDRGRVVVPAELRQRMHLEAGDSLVLIDTGVGLVLLTRQQLKARVRDELAGRSLTDELLAERRAAAAREEVA